jgi:hypothetical protein
MRNEISNEVVAARRDVELAKEDFRDSVHAATVASTRLAERAVSRAKPVIAVVVSVGALLLAVGLYKLARGPRRTNTWSAPPRRSFLGEVARTVLLSAATRLAAAVVLRVPLPALAARSEAPH